MKPCIGAPTGSRSSCTQRIKVPSDGSYESFINLYIIYNWLVNNTNNRLPVALTCYTRVLGLFMLNSLLKWEGLEAGNNNGLEL